MSCKRRKDRTADPERFTCPGRTVYKDVQIGCKLIVNVQIYAFRKPVIMRIDYYRGSRSRLISEIYRDFMFLIMVRVLLCEFFNLSPLRIAIFNASERMLKLRDVVHITERPDRFKNKHESHRIWRKTYDKMMLFDYKRIKIA